jgi:uncharacterized protein with HEPN domain
MVEYTEVDKYAFLNDRKTQDAVVRNIEIMGEAVKHLSPRFRTNHPDIPWKRIAGMRDVMIHDYFGVNLNLVWKVAKEEMPRLMKKIEEILSTLPPTPPPSG